MAVSRFSQTSLQNAFQKFNNVWDGKSAVGSMDAIGVVALSAASSTIDFTNIPQTYTHLQVRGIVKLSATNNIIIRFNSDSSSNYSYHYLYASGSALSTGNGASQTALIGTYATSATSVFGPLVMDILDYTSTSKHKTIRILTGIDTNGGGNVATYSGLWFKAGSGTTSNAVTSISFAGFSGETFQTYSHLALYGIK